MPSPFPGMDPYLEEPTRWAGVHFGLIYAIHAEINRHLPEGFVAEIDQYVWVTDGEDDRERLGKPDTFIPGGEDEPSANGYPADPAGVAAPTATVTLAGTTQRKNRAVRIVSAEDSRVVTVLEVLSPPNKNPGKDRDAYLSKRRDYFAAKANLVEIDLLRDGDRLPMGRPPPATADYYILVTRTAEYPAARIWSFSVREPFPVFPIPLDSKTPATPLDLRVCLDRMYADGLYDRKIDYTDEPIPPLRKPDAEWASEILKAATQNTKK